MLENVPIELIGEVATCSVAPSYISTSAGDIVESVAPLNFNAPNLIGVKDGIGEIGPPVEQQTWVSA